MYAIMVTMKAKPGARAQLVEALTLNATCALRDEPGCLQFQIVGDDADDDVLHLHEVYADEAAFEAHTKTEHFAQSVATTRPLQEEAPIFCKGTVVHPDAIK